MKKSTLFKNVNRITSAIMAIVAGMLTDLLYDALADEYFSGQIIEGEIQITRVGEYTMVNKVIVILALFFLLWLILSFIVPFGMCFVDSLRHYKIPVYVKEDILDTYNECRGKTLDLIAITQARDLEEQTDAMYAIVFKDACVLVKKLHTVFCSGKKRNDGIVVSSFGSIQKFV